VLRGLARGLGGLVILLAAALAAVYPYLRTSLPPLDRLAQRLSTASAWRYASNNSVADGRHTASGSPLLESDPHLTLIAPSPWYLMRVDFPGYELEGRTNPGAPSSSLG